MNFKTGVGLIAIFYLSFFVHPAAPLIAILLLALVIVLDNVGVLEPMGKTLRRLQEECLGDKRGAA